MIFDFLKYKMTKDNLLFLSSAVLIMMFIMGGFALQPVEEKTSFEQTIEKEPIPVLREGVLRPQFSAKAVYAIDLKSGKILIAKNPQEPVLPASTTKIATALVALEHYDTKDILTVGKIEVDGQRMELVEGEQISVRNLLYGLLVFSANDAAEVLAQSYPGGRENFISAMNRLAQTRRLTKTNFTNPAGLDEYLHFSTAEDLVKLASYAVQNPVFAEIVAIPRIDVASADGETIHELVNINQLVGRVPGVLGVKTGWTINSGESLISLVERDGQRIMIALLGSQDRFGETQKLIDWIFTSYSWE